jgi:hypothetical protein
VEIEIDINGYKISLGSCENALELIMVMVYYTGNMLSATRFYTLPLLI